jgi:MFS family permease
MDQEVAGNPRPEVSLWRQLGSFNRVYWIANWMELVERFAYYGVRTVLPVFMVTSFDKGGPQLDHLQKGTIYAVWAIVQSFVPILSGGFADRYGYKLNIAISTVLKIIGYLLMGYCIVLAEQIAGMPAAEARKQGADPTYAVFFAGAMFLALGTAIFKPGVQGLIANQMSQQSSSLGWGLFYQMVNIGGFVGPLLAGYLRVLDWEYVFLACAAGIALNFVPLFVFREPPRPQDSVDRHDGPGKILYRSMVGLLEPRLFFFTICFAGFWLMFYQLFDILPNFIDDWVDSRGAANALISVLGEGAVPVVNGGNLTQEWVINFNALLISVFAFLVGYYTGKIRSLSAIVLGIAISAVGIYGLGLSPSGYWILGAIAIFSLGEMSASPTMQRYLGDIAPPGKEGLYMGYSNFTIGIGWSVGSVVAGDLYQRGGDKIILAKRYLIEQAGVAKATIDGLEQDKVMSFFEQHLSVDSWQARALLWETYRPQDMWLVFTAIGLASLVALVVYNFAIRRADAGHSIAGGIPVRRWVQIALVPIVGIFTYFTVLAMRKDESYSGLMLNAIFFAVLLLISVVDARAGAGRATGQRG